MTELLTLLSKGTLKVPALEQIYRHYSGSPTFVADAISAMRRLDQEQAPRAAWLLCRRARDTGFDGAMLKEIAASADEMTHWLARLSLCQLFSRTGSPPSTRETIYPFLADCYRDRRVIVRAWALSAMARFADDIEYRDEISIFMHAARKDPAKAMQARLRCLTTSRRRTGC